MGLGPQPAAGASTHPRASTGGRGLDQLDSGLDLDMRHCIRRPPYLKQVAE
jgi:hypothetical protein